MSAKPIVVCLYLSLAISIAFLWTDCSSSSNTVMHEKFDVALRQKLQALQNDNRTEIIAVFGKCFQPIDERMRSQIGMRVHELQSVTGDIFAARIASDRLLPLADLDFVTQLQLSQELKPLSP